MVRIPLTRLRPCAGTSRVATPRRSPNQIRCIATSYLNKVADGQERWEERATRIQNGEERHVWDVLSERGYIKDVAGYELSR